MNWWQKFWQGLTNAAANAQTPKVTDVLTDVAAGPFIMAPWTLEQYYQAGIALGGSDPESALPTLANNLAAGPDIGGAVSNAGKQISKSVNSAISQTFTDLFSALPWQVYVLLAVVALVWLAPLFAGRIRE